MAAAVPEAPVAKSHAKGDFDFQVKLLLLGDSAVGKTCLLMRFTDDKFSSQFISTVGVDFKSKIIPDLEGSRVKLQLWDTAGQERFRTISLSFLRGAQGIALVFDATDRRSFDHVIDWRKQVQAQTDAIPMVLIANKSDLTDRYAVAHEEAEATAASMGVQLFWASAKTGENVQAALEHLGRLAAQKALAAKPQKSPEAASSGLVNLKESEPAVAAKGCAC